MHWFQTKQEEKDDHKHSYKAELEVYYETIEAAETGKIEMAVLTVTEFMFGQDTLEELVCSNHFVLSPVETRRSLTFEFGWARSGFLEKVEFAGRTLHRDIFTQSRPETILGMIVACVEHS